MRKIATVLIFNSKGELALQKRSLTDDLYPGCWDFSAGGKVDLGEDFHTAAVREMKEEAGVTGILVSPLVEFEYKEEGAHELIAVFKAVYDGPFNPDPKEVAEMKFFTLEEVKKMTESHPETFHVEFPYFLKHYPHFL